MVSHALNCYGAVGPIYNYGWAGADVHVHHTTATQLATLGALKEAQRCILGLLSMRNSNASQPSLLVSSLGKRFQESILSDFFRIFERHTDLDRSQIEQHSGGPNKPLNLDFPQFLDESIRTMVNENPSATRSQRIGWSSVPLQPEQGSPEMLRTTPVWSKMQKSASLCRRGWSAMDPTNEAAEHDYQQLQYVSRKERMADLRRPPQWCSVNEPVEISIDIRNPFRVPLVLKNLRLVAKIEEDASGVPEESQWPKARGAGPPW